MHSKTLFPAICIGGLLMLNACDGVRSNMQDWAKRNTLKTKQLPSLTSPVGRKKPMKMSFSACPRGSAIIEKDDAGQPKTCRSATGINFPAANAYQERYQNGNPKTQLVYQKDNLLKMNWYENGNPKEQTLYRESERNGAWRSWWQNGKLKGVGSYQDGKKSGSFSYWTVNAKPNSKGTYLSDKKHGLWVEFNKSGNMMARETWARGKRHGNAEYFHLDGSLKSHGRYQDGNLAGDWLWYHPNGNWQTRGSHNQSGEKEGEWKTFSQEGKLLTKKFYKDGKLIPRPTLAANLPFSGGDKLGARPPNTQPWKNKRRSVRRPTEQASSKRWKPL